jgi:FkbM family methyltransferase
MYFTELGPIRGSSMLWDFLGSGDYASFHMEGFRSPIWLRKRTSDIRIFEQVFLIKEYDFQLAHLPSPQVIVDAGANVGFSSIYLAEKYPTARIIAIEPEPTNYAMLLRNIEAYPNITPLKAALWPRKCYLEIRNPEAAKWAIQIKESEEDSPTAISAITINDILTLANCAQIDILKLDIEGAEKELFEENYESWLGRVKVIIIELHSWIEENEKHFNQTIGRFGFKKEFCSGEKIIAIRQ